MTCQNKSKRDTIIEMLEQGYDVKYICKELKTSKENVYKEKSIRKSKGNNKKVMRANRNSVRGKGGLPDHSRISNVDVEIEHRDSTSYVSNGTLRRPTRKEYKEIYSDFKEGKRPEDIIADHGIDAGIVAIEYQRFLKFRGMDPKALQISIDKISNKHSEQVVALIKKLDTGELLSNGEVMSLIQGARENYVLDLMSGKAQIMPDSPGFLLRSTCSECDKKLSGVLMDLADEDGKKISAFLDDYCCSECSKDMHTDDA
jgi:Helix-turn-helix domain of resolvase